MEFWTILLTIILTLILAYYFFSTANYFVTHKIPHHTPIPLLGNMWRVIARLESFVGHITSIYAIHPTAKYVGFYDFNYPVLVIRDLELIKSIAVKNFDHFINHRSFTDPDFEPLFGNNLFSLRDERWRSIRNLLSPAFTSSKMKAMFKLMSNCAATFAESLAIKQQQGVTEFNTKEIFTCYTNDAIATCAFGIAVDSMKDPNNEFYVLGRRATNIEGIRALKFFLARSYPEISKFFGIKLFDKEVEDFFYKLVRETIETRDKNNITRPDMIQLMMETRHQSKEAGSKVPELSIETMTSQAFIFFFGGFDTTSTLMCFVAHEIAANLEMQSRLQQEIDDVMEACAGDATYEAVNGMEYLDAVINEALRMYPVAGFIDRLCTKSFELPPSLPGQDPLVLKPGANVWFPIWAIHRDPQYFEDPDVFKPERFLGKGIKDGVNSAAYLPFGVGPRMCIGNRFALLETKVLLVYLLAKFNIRVGKRMIMPMRLSKMTFAITAEGGFWMTLEARHNK